ncbi:cobalt transporter, partial [Providencia thailandensis]|nr:cobalt transporter [Providencia thailandensis]
DVSSFAIISIIVDISIKNPKVQPVCFAIISKYLSLMNSEERASLICRLKLKFDKQPNIGYLEIWFQRAIKSYDNDIRYCENVCNYIYDKSIEIWNSCWISDKAILQTIRGISFIDDKLFLQAPSIIKSSEFDLFSKY